MRFPERARDILSNMNKFVLEFFFEEKQDRYILKEASGAPLIRFFKTNEEINPIIASHVCTVLLSLKDIGHRQMLTYMAKHKVDDLIAEHLYDYGISVELIEPLFFTVIINDTSDNISVSQSMSQKQDAKSGTESEQSDHKISSEYDEIESENKYVYRRAPANIDIDLVDDPRAVRRNSSTAKRSMKSSKESVIMTEELSKCLQAIFEFRTQFVLKLLGQAINSPNIFVAKNIQMLLSSFFSKAKELEEFPNFARASFYKHEFVTRLLQAIQTSCNKAQPFIYFCEILILLLQNFNFVFPKEASDDEEAKSGRHFFPIFNDYIDALNYILETVDSLERR